MNPATTRVLSALVLLPLLLVLIFWAPSWLFQLVLTIALILAARELRPLVSDVAAFVALVVIYLVMPIAALGSIREVWGPGVLMILIGTITASDSGQYYAGRTFGRRKLAPVISPKKTVEGAIGGLLVGSGAAILFGHYWPIGLSDIAMAGVGLLLTVAGIGGDLYESAMKRRAGAKDSGNLIPGHGGILDRIDSWLFAAPVFWLILKVTH